MDNYAHCIVQLSQSSLYFVLLVFQVLSNKSGNLSQPLRLVNLIEFTINRSRSFSPLTKRFRQTVGKYAKYYIFHIF